MWPDQDADWLDARRLTTYHETSGGRPGGSEVRLAVPGCRLRDRLSRVQRSEQHKHRLNPLVRRPDYTTVVTHGNSGHARTLLNGNRLISRVSLGQRDHHRLAPPVDLVVGGQPDSKALIQGRDRCRRTGAIGGAIVAGMTLPSSTSITRPRVRLISGFLSRSRPMWLPASSRLHFLGIILRLFPRMRPAEPAN